jgi:hypothetical protein
MADVSDEQERVIALTTGQVKKITPFVIAGLFLLRLVRRRRRHGDG